MSTAFVELSPKYLLDENWGISQPIPPEPALKLSPEEEKWRKWITSTRIEVAGLAETKKLSSDEKSEYLKSELGMNIIVPRGKIEEMRFKVTLKGDGQVSDEVKAIDGFPKDVIEEREIIGGKIKVGITKLFKFIPVVGAISDLLEIELNPWEFKIGSRRRVNVDFSGEGDKEPEWYFKEDGIKNDLRVALTIEKSKGIKTVEGEVVAAWIHDPGFWKRAKVGTDGRTVKIY